MHAGMGFMDVLASGLFLFGLPEYCQLDMINMRCQMFPMFDLWADPRGYVFYYDLVIETLNFPIKLSTVMYDIVGTAVCI